MTDAFRGALYLLRGFRLITRPGIRRYAIIPVILNVLVFIGLIGVALDVFGTLMDRWLPASDTALWMLLRGVLWLVVGLATTLAVYFSFTVVANLLGAPFNGVLAEAVETTLNPGFSPISASLGRVVADVPGALFNELKKIAYFSLWAIPLLTLFLIPVLALFAPLIWGVFMAWMLALEYVEYPMSNHRQPFRSVRCWLAGNRAMGLGFGGAVMLAMLIPGINLLVMPAAVAGATTLWVEAKQPPPAIHHND